MKIIINGETFHIKEEEAKKFIATMEGAGVKVESYPDDEDDEDNSMWKLVTREQMKEYDMEDFISSALYYAKLQPPDLIQFNEKCYAAVALFIKTFFLEFFHIQTRIHEGVQFMFDTLHSAVLKKSHTFGKTFHLAELAFYQHESLKPTCRDELIDGLTQMTKMVEYIDKERVKKILEDSADVAESGFEIVNIKQRKIRYGKKDYIVKKELKFIPKDNATDQKPK